MTVEQLSQASDFTDQLIAAVHDDHRGPGAVRGPAARPRSSATSSPGTACSRPLSAAASRQRSSGRCPAGGPPAERLSRARPPNCWRVASPVALDRMVTVPLARFPASPPSPGITELLVTAGPCPGHRQSATVQDGAADELPSAAARSPTSRRTAARSGRRSRWPALRGDSTSSRPSSAGKSSPPPPTPGTGGEPQSRRVPGTAHRADHQAAQMKYLNVKWPSPQRPLRGRSTCTQAP